MLHVLVNMNEHKNACPNTWMIKITRKN